MTAAVVAHNPSTRWQVAGGVDTGGILVRDGRPLTSSELGRLGTGALVEDCSQQLLQMLLAAPAVPSAPAATAALA